MESRPTTHVFQCFYNLFPNLAPDEIQVISQPGDLIYFDGDKGVSNLMAYQSLCYSPSILRIAELQDITFVVAIDNSRKDNDGTPVVSSGVWFGSESVYNQNDSLPVDLSQRVQAAELRIIQDCKLSAKRFIYPQRTPVLTISSS